MQRSVYFSFRGLLLLGSEFGPLLYLNFCLSVANSLWNNHHSKKKAIKIQNIPTFSPHFFSCLSHVPLCPCCLGPPCTECKGAWFQTCSAAFSAWKVRAARRLGWIPDSLKFPWSARTQKKIQAWMLRRDSDTREGHLLDLNHRHIDIGLFTWPI